MLCMGFTGNGWQLMSKYTIHRVLLRNSCTSFYGRYHHHPASVLYHHHHHLTHYQNTSPFTFYYYHQTKNK